MSDLKQQTKDPLEGRIIFLLVLTILVQFSYPVTASGNIVISLAYQSVYISLFVAGIYLVSTNRRQMYLLIGLTIAWVVVGAFYTFYPDYWLGNFLGYPILVIFQGLLTLVLLKYIFRARIVNRDVLLAACAVYLLIGGIFVSVFGMIETATWFATGNHAFADGVQALPTDRPIPWQTLGYYSYATLSTLGYGDVLPVTYAARSAATLEAVIGVLYTGIIVARLVGLYATKEVEEELEEMGVIQ